MVNLKFTSEHALRRSIKEKYPKLSKEAQEATFEDHKKYIGQGSTEKILADKYEEYKRNNT